MGSGVIPGRHPPLILNYVAASSRQQYSRIMPRTHQRTKSHGFDTWLCFLPKAEDIFANRVL